MNAPVCPRCGKRVPVPITWWAKDVDVNGVVTHVAVCSEACAQVMQSEIPCDDRGLPLSPEAMVEHDRKNRERQRVIPEVVEHVAVSVERAENVGECRCKSLLNGHEPGCPSAK